jgi:hypothetical protein
VDTDGVWTVLAKGRNNDKPRSMNATGDFITIKPGDHFKMKQAISKIEKDCCWQ